MTDTNLIILGFGLIAIVLVVLDIALIRLGRPASKDIARLKADNNAMAKANEEMAMANDTLREIVKERDKQSVEDQNAFRRQMNVIIARDEKIAELEERIAFLIKVNDGLLRVQASRVIV